MRRFLCAFLVSTLLFTMCSCGFSDSIKDKGTFYYRRTEFLYGKDGSVMDSETKDITGHANDLSYLVALYMLGPTEDTLVSPFPKNVKLLSAQIEDQSILIQFTSLDRYMSDSDFTLACACLTLTCLGLTDATEVTIASGDRSITMTQDMLLLTDSIIPTETIAEEE